MHLTDLYCHRRFISAKVHCLIFVRHKKAVWELSEPYRMCRAIHRSTDSSHYFPYPFTDGKITRFLITITQKLYIKSAFFTVCVLTSVFFNCCVLDDGIIKAFSLAFYLFIAILVLLLFQIPQIYLSRILSDWFWSFLFSGRKIQGCDL